MLRNAVLGTAFSFASAACLAAWPPPRDYSGFDELKTLTSPDTGVTQYTYDAAGNVKTMQDARGQSAAYTYDAVNRLKTLLYADESLAFTYDDTTIAPCMLVKSAGPITCG